LVPEVRPPAAADAPAAPADTLSAPSTVSLSPPSLPPRELAPEPSRPTRARKPTQWLHDIANGKGTTGGRGAAKVPDSVVPPGTHPHTQHLQMANGSKEPLPCSRPEPCLLEMRHC
jgi:hypothetical protein